MLKKLILFIGLLFCANTARAVETCDAGYYLNDGVCSRCPVKTYKDTIGPQECTPCPPADETTWRTQIPDQYYPYDPVTGTYIKTTEPTLKSCNLTSWYGGFDALNMCNVGYTYTNVAGLVWIEVVYYNPETGKYDRNVGTVGYMKANPGYYLDTRFTETYCSTDPNTRRKIYQKAIKCPAGYYCPGGDIPPCTDGPYETEWGRTICPVGKYCPAGSAAPIDCPTGTYRTAEGGVSIDDCTACPAGTSTRTDAAGSAADCLLLCVGGITKLHAGQNVFTLWKDKHTSPSIHIRAPGGDVCYVNLTPGVATNAININYNGQIYHTVD